MTQDKRPGPSRSPNTQRLLIGGVAVVALSVVIFFVLSGNLDQSAESDRANEIAATTSESSEGAEFAFVSAPALHSGNPNAPVIITLFEDFHCSACAYFNRVTMTEIAERFIATGQVKVEFRHFVHYGDDSLIAAEAAECVNEQDVEYGTRRFREFHDLLFANQGERLEPRLLEFATEVGVRDLQAFNHCMESGKYIEKIRASTSWIVAQGARGTPAIIAGDELYVGVPSMAALERAIADKLQ